PPAARIVATVASVEVGSRSLTTTRAPSRARASAPARPRPEPAPGTRAMRFWRRMRRLYHVGPRRLDDLSLERPRLRRRHSGVENEAFCHTDAAAKRRARLERRPLRPL